MYSNFNDIHIWGGGKGKLNLGFLSKIWEGERCKFGEVLGKCRNYRFFDIFWDILDKGKGNLGEECVKRRLLIFQGKIGTTSSDFPGKMIVFLVLALLFHQSLYKI